MKLKAEARGELIPKAAEAFLYETRLNGHEPCTDSYISRLEAISPEEVKKWRTLLLNKKYRGLLKLRAGNLCQPYKFTATVRTPRNCLCANDSDSANTLINNNEFQNALFS